MYDFIMVCVMCASLVRLVQIETDFHEGDE